LKLLSLRLEGFMPYRTAQFIDFRDKSIFALVGPTGSGKSALLDAITFAFFVKTPRWADERGGRELISQGEKRLTVQVEFQVKDNTYQVSRVVKRGKTQSTQEVQLLQWVNGDFKPRTTERLTPTAVNEHLVSLLNMDYATFTRTLMLPQGQFDRLLKPETPRERKDLLIRLAGLEVYDRLYEKLTQKQRPIEDELKRLEGQLQGYEELDPAQIFLLEAERDQLLALLLDLASQRAESQQRVQQLKHDLEISRQLQDLSSQLESLQAQDGHIQQLRQRLQKSSEVESQSGHLQHLDQLRQNHAQRERQLLVLEADLERAQEQLTQAEAELESAQKQAARIPELEQEQQEMGRLLEVIRGYEELLAEQRALSLTPLQTQLTGLEQELSQQQSDLLCCQQQLLQCQQSLSQLGESSQSAHWQSALDLRRSLDQAEKQHHDSQAQLTQNLEHQARLQPKLSQSEEHLQSLQTEHDQVSAALKALEQELQAEVLRAQLRPNCPCPVCLQTVTSLPAPSSSAEPSQLSQLEKSLQQAWQRLQEAQKARDQLNHQLAALNLQQPLLEEQLETARHRSQEALHQFVDRFEQRLDKAELETRLKQAQKDDHERDHLMRQHQRLEQLQSSLNTSIQVSQTRQQSLQEQIEERKRQLKSLDERVGARQEELHRQLGSDQDFAATAQQRLNQAQSQQTRLRQQLKEAEKLQRDSQSERDKQHSVLSVQRQQQEETATQRAQLEQQLLNFLQQANLSDEQALRTLLLSPEQAHQLRRQVEEHGQQVHTFRQRKQELENQLGPRRPSPTDLAEAQQTEIQLGQSQEQCSRRHGALEEQIRQLQNDLQQQAQLRQQLQALTSQLKLHKKLGQMLTATGLKAFVANRLLQEILRLASTELERLSGRYQLQLKKDGDIQVVDSWNAGEPRDVRSLSGGETFLASLSLALAMVEYLSQGSPLESLFIDEGFGTLDPETLEAVTLTLESLHQKGRLVGVITHVQELADRLPMQLRVEKGQGQSRVV